MDDSSSVEAGQVGLEMKPMIYHQRPPSQGEVDGAGDYGRETYDNYSANSGWLRPSYTDPTRYDQVPLDNENNRATDYNSNDSRPHDVSIAPTTGLMVELGGGVVAWTGRGPSPRSSVSDDADRTCRGKDTTSAPFRNSAGSETDNRSRRVSDESVTSHDSVKSPTDGGCVYWPGQGTETSLLLDGRPDSDTILDSYQDPNNQNPRTYTTLL